MITNVFPSFLSSPISLALNIYVRAPETEVHYWAVFLRDLTVQELIKRVVQKYGFSDDELDRVKMAVRVPPPSSSSRSSSSSPSATRGGGSGSGSGGVQHLTDEDVRTMESEVAIDVKVTSLEPQSDDWQLELRY